MVEAEIGRDFLRLRGHATGSEAVCAAVSALALSLCDYLRKHGAAAESQTGCGSYFVRILPAGAAALEMTADALAALARTYPQYLRVTEHFVRLVDEKQKKV